MQVNCVLMRASLEVFQQAPNASAQKQILLNKYQQANKIPSLN